MKLKDKPRQMKGTFTLAVIDRAGDTIATYTKRNLIVATGYAAVADAIGGVAGANIAQLAVGTNDANPVETDTAIQNAETFPFVSIEYPEPTSIQFNFSIDYDDANGMDINEFGLMTQDGRLFSRITREYISKTDAIMLVGSWTINI